jgi:hypothetical protein
VHSLVILAFVGPRPDGEQVRHLNGNPADNRLTNLAYGTQSQNQQDSLRHGTHAQAAKTHCPRGHSYLDEGNVMHRRTGGRRCRACHAIQRQESMARLRARRTA